jgi:hypothetical protein
MARVIKVQASTVPRRRRSRARKVKVSVKVPKTAKSRNAKAVLSAGARKYRDLLLDPCLGPLVHPPIQGGDCGYLIRVKQIITLPQAAATNTSYGVYYHPSTQQWYQFEAATSTSTLPTTFTSTYSAGNILTGSSLGPLSGFASQTRAVAACMTFTYNGPESSRAGRVSYTNQMSVESWGDSIGSGSTGALLAQACAEDVRTPQTSIVCRWYPDRSSVRFFDVGSVGLNNPVNFQGHTDMRNGMMIVVNSGSNSSNQCSVELVTVFEWTPKIEPTSNGIVMEADRARISETQDEVINTIDDHIWNFVEGMFPRIASKVGSAAMTGIMNGMAAMSVQPRRSGRQNLLA